MNDNLEKYIKNSDWNGLKLEVLKPKYFSDAQISSVEINDDLLSCWRMLSEDFDTELLIENAYRDAVVNWRSEIENIDFTRAIFRLALFIIYTMNVTEFSRELMEHAVDMFSRILGEENPETAQAINDFGYILNELGEKDKSLEMYQKAFEIRERILPPLSAEIAESLSNIASHYDNERALPYFQKSLEIRRQVLGLNHPETMNSIQSLAATLDLLKRPDEADALLIDAIKRCEIAYGENGEPVATVLDCYAIFLWHNKYFVQAAEVAIRALNIKEQIFGKDSVKLLISLDVLSQAYRFNQQFDEGQAALERALKILEQTGRSTDTEIEKFEAMLDELNQDREDFLLDEEAEVVLLPRNRLS